MGPRAPSWTATGDTEPAVPAFLAAVRPRAQSMYHFVMLADEVPRLIQVGPAAHLLHAVPNSDLRVHGSGNWRASTEDETIRAAVEDLMTAAG